MTSPDLHSKLLTAQEAEITEHHLYLRLAGALEDPRDRAVLERIAQDELSHYQVLKEITGREVAPRRWFVWLFFWMARILGYTFALRLMERGEDRAQRVYRQVGVQAPQVAGLAEDEAQHEEHLIAMLDEERLRYASSMVLGLNDALVELTGAIAGFTLALQETRLVALTAAVTGVAAALSMASSEYLSTKAEPDSGKDPLKASLYTGAAYGLAVVVLVAPFLAFGHLFTALAWTLGGAMVLILGFTYYLSVAKGRPFWPGYLEMAGISLGVAAISFLIGYLLRELVGVDV